MCMVAFVIFEQELGSFNFRRVRADIRPASNQCGRILLDPHKECDLEIWRGPTLFEPKLPNLFILTAHN